MHIDGRTHGSPPNCLLDYFPEDFLLVIDESHVAVPQIGGMYEGDMSRKRNLVDHGFRLPSAMDNRPLRWDEFLERIGQTIYLSATPGNYELAKVDGEVVEQIIRPTGLVDPEVIVKPTKGQIDDLIHEINNRVELGPGAYPVVLEPAAVGTLLEFLGGAGVQRPRARRGPRRAQRPARHARRRAGDRPRRRPRRAARRCRAASTSRACRRRR